MPSSCEQPSHDSPLPAMSAFICRVSLTIAATHPAAVYAACAFSISPRKGTATACAPACVTGFLLRAWFAAALNATVRASARVSTVRVIMHVHIRTILRQIKRRTFMIPV